MISKYLDPKNDYAFKKIFGEEKHKRIPIAFLNAVFHLEGKNRIIDLEFLNPTQVPAIAARKESVVDLLVRDQNGAKYIVEMQVAKIEGFEKRAQFYAAKTYCAHFNVGQAYHELKKVIFLAITSYVVFPEKKDYKSDHVILDNKTYQHDLKDFSFSFVELPKFTKNVGELETLEEKWYYFLKHADESNEVAELMKSPEIREAYEVVERSSWSEQEFIQYERAAMAIADAKGALSAAKKEGLEEGRQEGIKEGAKAAYLKMAKALLVQGMRTEQIQALTGLSEKEI
jgi:conserved hypothetical protein (putative transposase or invertase)